MRSLTKWIAGGVGAGLLAAVVMYAPASWLASHIEQATSGQVLLQAPRGTAWRGSADLVLTGGAGSSGQVALPTRLYWQMSPARLGLNVQLHSACCALAASPILLGLRLDGLGLPPDMTWRFDAQNVVLPAELLVGLGAPWNTLQLSGTLKLVSEGLAGRWSSSEGLTSMTGRATLEMLEVATALSTVRPLGSYRLVSTGAVMQLETLGGASTDAALLLSGTGKIERGRLGFLGEALPAAGREEALSNLLHIVGQWQTSADGRARAILKL